MKRLFKSTKYIVVMVMVGLMVGSAFLMATASKNAPVQMVPQNFSALADSKTSGMNTSPVLNLPPYLLPWVWKRGLSSYIHSRPKMPRIPMWNRLLARRMLRVRSIWLEWAFQVN